MFKSIFRVIFFIFIFFLPISFEMYSLFWLHMTVHSKINIFELVALHLNTCIGLETILGINAKNGV